MDNFSARRKVLKGSLAAPVVLTVVSPSAIAQTTFTSCLANGAPPPSSYVTTSEDSYYRVPKDTNLINVQGTKIRGYEFNGTYYSVINGSQLSGPVVGNTTESRYLIAYINNNGTVLGWGFPNTNGGGSLAMKSCYNSLLIQPQ